MSRGRGERNQARSGDLASSYRPRPPSSFPEPNILGHGISNAYTSQQFQAQVGHPGHGLGPPPPLPPRIIPAQPTFPSDYASRVPYQQGTGHVNNQVNHSRPSFSEGFPQPHRVPDQSPPYDRNGPPGRLEPPPYSPSPVLSQSLTSRGPPTYDRPSSGQSRPHRSPPPQIPTPHLRPSTSARPYHPYGVGHYQAHQLHAPATQHYPPQGGQKKALVVGIDYSRHRDTELRLMWGVHDAREMARFLQEDLDFHSNNILVLTDDQRDQRRNLPTAANILAGMRWLVEGAQPGDCLFFYFSGHATQIEDRDGDELDGFDECVCAMDYDDRRNPPRGIIVDDTIHDIMVKPLPRGCRLTAVLDCCNSGTLLDLPYIYAPNGVLELNTPDIVQRKKSDAVVISLSACMDSGRAYEVRGGGALREAFIRYMKRFGNRGTHLQVIQNLHAHMAANGLSQFPQLSSSHWIDTDQPFIITR